MAGCEGLVGPCQLSTTPPGGASPPTTSKPPKTHLQAPQNTLQLRTLEVVVRNHQAANHVARAVLVRGVRCRVPQAPAAGALSLAEEPRTPPGAPGGAAAKVRRNPSPHCLAWRELALGALAARGTSISGVFFVRSTPPGVVTHRRRHSRETKPLKCVPGSAKGLNARSVTRCLFPLSPQPPLAPPPPKVSRMTILVCRPSLMAARHLAPAQRE